MRWSLAVGNNRERLEGLRRRGQKVAILDNEPDLLPDLVPVWSAFAKLSAGRPVSEAGPGGLPSDQIIAYLEFIGVRDEDSRLEFFHLIRHLDGVFLDWYGKQQDGKHRATGGRSPQRRGAR